MGAKQNPRGANPTIKTKNNFLLDLHPKIYKDCMQKIYLLSVITQASTKTTLTSSHLILKLQQGQFNTECIIVNLLRNIKAALIADSL